jgi:hypothetical protein
MQLSNKYVALSSSFNQPKNIKAKRTTATDNQNFIPTNIKQEESKHDFKGNAKLRAV